MCLYKQHGLVSRVDTRCSLLESYSQCCHSCLFCYLRSLGGFNLSHVASRSTSAVAAAHPWLSFQTLLPNCHKSCDIEPSPSATETFATNLVVYFIDFIVGLPKSELYELSDVP